MTFPYQFPFTFPAIKTETPATITLPITGWWAELSGNVAVTVTPVVSATIAHLNISDVAVTPTVTAAGYLTVLSGAAASVTPTVTASGYLSVAGGTATTVTPTVGAVGRAVGAVAATATPSVSATGQPSGSSTISVTPSVSATGISQGTAAVTTTPSVTTTGAVMGSGTASVTVTPSVTADGSLTAFAGTASVTTTPSVAAAGSPLGDSLIVTTPSVTTAGFLTASGSSAVTVTPSVLGTGYLGLSGTAAVTTTPSVTVGGALVTPVSFDAVGAGYLSPTNTGTTTPSWSHVNAGNGAVVFVDLYCSSASPTMSATFGGTAMTPGPSVAYVAGSGFFGYVFSFYLLSAPTGGSKTVALSFSAGAAYDVVANSLTYKNVTSFASGGTNFNSTGSNPSMSTTSATGKMVANAFGGYTTTFTAYNQTQRYNQPLGAASLAFLMGDAAGAASVTFSATGSQPWGGIAIQVQ